MNDWAKVALAGLVGLIAGLIAEPLKFWITTRLKVAMIRRTLYRTIAFAQWFISGPVNFASEFVVVSSDGSEKKSDRNASAALMDKSSFYRRV